MLKSDDEMVDWDKTRRMRRMLEQGGFHVSTGRPFRSEVDAGYSLTATQIKAFNKIFRVIAKEIQESKFAKAYREGDVRASIQFSVGATTSLLLSAHYPHGPQWDAPDLSGAWSIGKRGKITSIARDYIPELLTNEESTDPIEQGLGWIFPSGYFQ